MKMLPRHLVLAFLLAVGLAPGCGKGTYLEVRFIGTGLPELRGIAVDLALTNGDGGVTHSRGVFRPEGSDPKLTLPTSAAFVLDSESGTLMINASALGVQDEVVATASKSTTIMHAKTWTVTLDFNAVSTTALE